MKPGLLVTTAVSCLMFAAASACIAAEDAKVQAKQAQRQAPAATIAPAPLPKDIPLLGPAGQDAAGYPNRYVDRAGLRSLLWHKRYADLTRYFEQFQSDFESDPRNEYWPSDAGDAFASAEPALRPALDAWVAATPKSFAPYLARGTYLVDVAYARRGTQFADKTSREEFAAMEQTLNAAFADLDRALELRPRLVAAMREKIVGLRDIKKARPVIDQAIKACPSCFQVRVAYMYGLTPRWGGSHDAMLQFAKERIDRSNPRMQLLPGYIDLDKAQMLVLSKKPKEALPAIERACSLGEHWEFLRERADIRGRLGDLEGALKDLDRALALRPGHPQTLLARGHLQQRASRWEAAARDLIAGLRMKPTDATGRHALDRTVEGLVYDGWGHYKAGRRNDALRLYDLAAELAPTNADVQFRRAAIVGGKSDSGGEKIAMLEERARKSPDDFRAHQELDYTLAAQQQFPRIVEMWTAYIARNPQNAAAYLERGGAHFRMENMNAAHADAQKACELGNSEACARAKQMRSMLKK
jgi:tetratricopeptide (TPR) repeat protein